MSVEHDLQTGGGFSISGLTLLNSNLSIRDCVSIEDSLSYLDDLRIDESISINDLTFYENTLSTFDDIRVDDSLSTIESIGDSYISTRLIFQ